MLVSLAALAFVLGMILLLAHAARRWMAPRASTPAHRIEVLARAGLGPKQGVATVRTCGRVALVSWGEGGVRMLCELDPRSVDEWNGEERRAQAEPAARPEAQAPRPLRARRGTLRALFGALTLVGALLLPQRTASAQATGAAAAARAAASAAAGAAADAAANATKATTAGDAPTASPSGTLDAQALSRVLPRMDVQLGGPGAEGLHLSGPVGAVIAMGALTLLPTLLLLMTSFTRILIVLHLLKQALGTQTVPPAHLLTAMALLLTGFVMAPTLSEVNRTAVAPWVDGQMDEMTMIKAAIVPFRGFMLKATRRDDLEQFVAMSPTPAPASPDQVSTVTLTSAFVVSELTSAFQMGFAVFLPFLVIDVVVASVLMSMGMFMLPPMMVSLPFKLLLFVMVDGWSLVVSSLVRSF